MSWVELALDENNEPVGYNPDHCESGHMMPLSDAIDLASDQSQSTWLTRDGKRIAAIVTTEVGTAAEEAENDLLRTKAARWVKVEFRALVEPGWQPAGDPLPVAAALAHAVGSAHISDIEISDEQQPGSHRVRMLGPTVDNMRVEFVPE